MPSCCKHLEPLRAVMLYPRPCFRAFIRIPLSQYLKKGWNYFGEFYFWSLWTKSSGIVMYQSAPFPHFKPRLKRPPESKVRWGGQLDCPGVKVKGLGREAERWAPRGGRHLPEGPYPLRDSSPTRTAYSTRRTTGPRRPILQSKGGGGCLGFSPVEQHSCALRPPTNNRRRL